MLKLRSPSQQEQILSLAMSQIEKMLKEMQTNGKDLSLLKLKKFQQVVLNGRKNSQMKKGV